MGCHRGKQVTGCLYPVTKIRADLAVREESLDEKEEKDEEEGDEKDCPRP